MANLTPTLYTRQVQTVLNNSRPRPNFDRIFCMTLNSRSGVWSPLFVHMKSRSAVSAQLCLVRLPQVWCRVVSSNALEQLASFCDAASLAGHAACPARPGTLRWRLVTCVRLMQAKTEQFLYIASRQSQFTHDYSIHESI